MSWVYLIAAILFEIFATSMLKLAEGFTVFVPSAATVVGYAFSFFFLSQSLKTLDMSVVYAIWSALGIVLISIIGIFFFHEHVSFLKILFISLILVGTVGLKLIH